LELYHEALANYSDMSQTNGIEYTTATYHHCEAIAKLHAYSWQVHYRGILNDSYLDHDVVDERLEVWQRRFEHPSKDQYVVLANDDSLLCGFACVFLNHDDRYGSLVDNLHVHPDWQRRGIGRELMIHCVEQVHQLGDPFKMYLWVLKENHKARKFYQSIGGETVEQTIENNPGGGQAEVLRIFWNTPPN
jgi:GNAT superfamily N-acetyltransferase